ncbi:MAG: hypothetical protein SH819_07110 [Cytophagales bacterium]|nr:hypothetical protein [Cytophagales bacterium]
MSTTRKFAIGLGLAGGALLAAWLLTGPRKKRTRDFLVRKAVDLKKTLQKKKDVFHDDTDVNYV